MSEKVKYGEKNLLPEGELAVRDVKVRITMMIDGDLLEMIRGVAAKRDTKYQTLINETLRDLFMRGEARATLASLTQRMDKLEAQANMVEILERMFAKNTAAKRAQRTPAKRSAGR